MEGLLSLLLFAGLFFVMMRFGCGAHMVHGNHGHGGHTSDAKSSHLDIVCGMAVQQDQGYGKMYQGQLYRFCSKNCLNRFDEEPDKYINNPQTNDEEGMM